MPFVYVYSPSDFIGGLPDEQGAAAAGSGKFELTLSPDASPTLIEIDDDDSVFDEVDYGQTIADGVNLDGTKYEAGTTIHSAYDLINTSTGHQVTSIHFGGTGYEQGAVHGLISTEPLEAGKSYTFNYERTSHQKANNYDTFVACFVAGNQVRTQAGNVNIENLRPGQLVETIDGANQTVRLVLKRELSAADLENTNLRPVRITAGAMGQGLPHRDLLVSPQHRMLVSGPTCLRVFGEDEALVSARKLTELPGVYVDMDVEHVTYVHLVFDQHEIIYAEGAPSESFFLGTQAIDSLSEDAREELMQLFPDFAASDHDIETARAIPKGKAQTNFVKRLLKNAQTPLSPIAES